MKKITNDSMSKVYGGVNCFVTGVVFGGMILAQWGGLGLYLDAKNIHHCWTT